MTVDGTIQYLQRHEIDSKKWDACIDRAPNGLVYGYTVYLDTMADNWDGLVWNDYEAVMPLPWRKKWGIYYLYQPFLVAQLGVFGNLISSALMEAALDAIPSKFRLWEFPLNHHNLWKLSRYSLQQRINYVLPLQDPYEIIYNGYRENTKRNIKKSLQYGCYSKKGIEVQQVMELSRQQIKNISTAEYQKALTLFRTVPRETYGIFSAKDELLASCVFIFSHKRAYYILVGNHPNGRTLGASHALIDAFIRDHAGQSLLLDFEGSDISNLAFFYSSFGATEEKYSAIRFNRLPWYVKWMKE